MPNLFRNNAATTLANPVLTSDTTLVLAANTGARFPTPVIGEWFFVTVQSGVNFEIMKCTARAGDILTVERAQDGSSLQNWLAGNSVDMRIPRITLENFLQKNEVALLAAGSAAAPSVSFSGDADTGALNPGTNQYAIATGGAVRLLVDASSYVGVNTLTPARQFEVASPNNHMRFSVPGDATAYYDFGRDNTDGFFFFNGAQPTFVINGNNGGGGGYGNGGGTNIGVGGRALGAASGYGAGGGGATNNSNAAGTGGVGTAGVVYVLRGI